MTTKVVLRGNCDLSKPSIPDSWLGRDKILHCSEYNISKRFKNQKLYKRVLQNVFSDLEIVKKRLRQEKYWEHNTNREGLVEYDFSDSFEECQWLMWGVKKGKHGNMSL